VALGDLVGLAGKITKDMIENMVDDMVATALCD
jgi:hypothetical protein